MNFKLILKLFSLSLLVVGVGQAAFAMEKSADQDLLEAARTGSLALVQKALIFGANINCGNTIFTPLHYASIRNYRGIAKFLLEHGADVNRANCSGNTSLHMVASASRGGDYFEIVKLLVNNGADINCKNKDGYTALDMAKAYKRDEKIIKLITEEAQRQEKTKQEISKQEFNKWQALCSQRLLETWNRINATDPKNLDPLISFTNRDKQEKIELKNPDLAQAAQIAKTNQSVFDWFFSVLSDFSA